MTSSSQWQYQKKGHELRQFDDRDYRKEAWYNLDKEDSHKVELDSGP